MVYLFFVLKYFLYNLKIFFSNLIYIINTMSNLKPFLVGGIIVGLDKLVLNQPNINSSIYFGVSGIAGIYLAQNLAQMLPSNQGSISTMIDTKTLETRMLEVSLGAGATYAINKFALNNDLRPNDLLNKVGVILAADFVAEYIDDYMNNRPLSFLK
jgi:hypothetical protein